LQSRGLEGFQFQEIVSTTLEARNEAVRDFEAKTDEFLIKVIVNINNILTSRGVLIDEELLNALQLHMIKSRTVVSH
jgi:hypothetical protein